MVISRYEMSLLMFISLGCYEIILHNYGLCYNYINCLLVVSANVIIKSQFRVSFLVGTI